MRMIGKIMATKEEKLQEFGDNPIEIRDTDHYKEEYIHQFVDKWDQLIDWDARETSEGQFFIDELKKRGARRVLDAAAGTGFHSVRLLRAGFEVVTADGSPEMLAKAFANGKDRGFILRTVQADWRWMNRDVHGKFDAVICLGNSFTHLHSEHDRRKTLAEFYALLNHDGVLILDQRNYDSMLDHGFSSKHTYYYCGDNVKAEPEHIDPGLARFRYEFPDKSVFHLNMFPLRKDYTTRLMREVGFQRIKTYGDFQETYHDDDPDFFIHVAEKKYLDPSELEEDYRGRTAVVADSRNYYDSAEADNFYAKIWGGEDIHVGVYDKKGESIAEASQRTLDRMTGLLPKGIDSEARILDLGAGYGGSARYLVRKYGCHVTCLNISNVQNRRNRRLNAEAGLTGKIDVDEGDFENVPYADERFDVVWSQDSFLHSGDRRKAIHEAARVLKSGGTLIFTDPMQSESADEATLKPVLERLKLDSLGSVEFYRQAAQDFDLEEVEFVDLSENLSKHYGAVLDQLERHRDELLEKSGKKYVENMARGLRHWVENGEKGNLKWGILVFRKK